MYKLKKVSPRRGLDTENVPSCHFDDDPCTRDLKVLVVSTPAANSCHPLADRERVRCALSEWPSTYTLSRLSLFSEILIAVGAIRATP